VLATSATTGVMAAQGAVDRAKAGVDEAEKALESAHARLEGAKSNVKEVDASTRKFVRDAERLKGLLAKDEVSQQQYDAAEAAADAQKAAVEAAQGGVGEAEAGVRVAESRLMQTRAAEQQARAALESSQTAPQQITAIHARAAAAQAHVEQLRAQLAQAELNLRYAKVKAPVNGIVSKKGVEPGQLVQAGQPLLSIIPLNDVWVTANFKETQLDRMRPGEPVTIDVDAYPDASFSGRVASIQHGTGARFSVLPPENATGNYVKVVQRVPVKILFDGDQLRRFDRVLAPGMSVVPTVEVR
jgi:membrane fusion protein, multidrug efflux system